MFLYFKQVNWPVFYQINLYLFEIYNPPSSPQAITSYKGVTAIIC